MASLLAELQPVCTHCEALGAKDASRCPSCGRSFGPSGPPLPVTREFAPPRERPRRLVFLRGVEKAGTAFDLGAGDVGLGRTRGEILFPADDTLAPLSATLSWREGSLHLRDEGGPSGVFVRIRREVPLSPGDCFALGDQLLCFRGLVSPSGPRSRTLGSPLPAQGPLFRLERILLGGQPGRTYLLPAPIRIGRVSGQILLAEDPFVSARHAALHFFEGRPLLQDLGSSNGTFLRLPAMGEVELLPGDVVRLGRNILRVD